MVLCSNNVYDPRLRSNGGKDVFGTHAQCYRKGYVLGKNQVVKDTPRFVQKWGGRYKAHISQKLWYSDDPMPPGYQLATLSQNMGRGFAFGCIARAKQLKQKVRTNSPSATKKPTLPLKTSSRTHLPPGVSADRSHRYTFGAVQG